MVFISHRIHELKAICDTLTVLRDGRLIESGPMGPLSGEQIVEKMLGHELSDIFPPPRPPHGEEVLLQVDGLHDEALLQDISLRLRKGEILGIAGLAGAGKTELCKALFGRQQKPGAAWRAERPAVATARSGRLGGARPGAGPGGATQRGHFH
ncbi:putative ABC transport system ATPase component [Klebsiella pneumoniae]|uniref:Putative ABC transport system ATPase component n=1 Tax=Klebsiella pneumoniae TaxID=573 RepID=A0A2X3F6M7_KLEPN|nr:putative ABC transport system ATPase component [Klebsiella pneumoniae]